MKSEPSATTITNETFTRRQCLWLHLPYVTPSAGCGLPLFRLSGKFFKTEISYKRRESTEYIQQNKADTSQFSAMQSPVPAMSGGKLASPVRTCARGWLHQAALWVQALNCCQPWSAAGRTAFTIRQPAGPLPLSQCEAVGPHGSMLQSYSVTCWYSHFGKAL